MKVLALSITAGNGHNATAKAVQDYLISRGAECRFLDTFQYLSPFLATTTNNVFTLSAKYAQKPYALAYRLCEKMKGAEFAPMRELTLHLAAKLKEYLDEYKPDVVLASHVFPCQILSMLKQQPGNNFTAIGILTDFTYHPFWEACTGLDYLVTPNELFALEGTKRGFKKDQLLPFGIPVATKFAKAPKHSKEQIRKALGLDPDCPTVLIMSGSMGHGSISKTVKLLDSLPTKLQMIAVCGTNKEERRKIAMESYEKQVRPLGWVDYVDKLMDGSDCVITKPGGITTSEALAKKLPMIMINPLPGQEDRNIEFLLNAGVAMLASKTNPLDNVLYQMLTTPGRIDAMKQGMDFLRRPDSTQTLGDFILNQPIRF